jgi:hypothetical protein
LPVFGAEVLDDELVALGEYVVGGIESALVGDCYCHFKVVVLERKMVCERFDFRCDEICGEGDVPIAVFERKGPVYLCLALPEDGGEFIKVFAEEVVSEEIEEDEVEFFLVECFYGLVEKGVEVLQDGGCIGGGEGIVVAYMFDDQAEYS